MSDIRELRDWMLANYGTDYGASDAALTALFSKAEAKRRKLGYGNAYIMAALWVKESYDGPTPLERP